MTLDQLKINQPAKVVRVDSTPELRRQLEDVGFLLGEPVIVLRRALFKGNLVVRIGSSTFALRPHEAQTIVVNLIES